MTELTAALLGGTGLEMWQFAVLCAASFTGSFITASLGLGGGVLMLAVLALFISPAVLIPVHGAVQLGSNAGRTMLMWREVMRHLLPAFLLGSILGAAVGGQLVVTLPTALLQFILALFILYAVWSPKFSASQPGQKTFFGVGAVAALATMFVGATGPLIAPFIAAAGTDRRQVVATHAIMMTAQHGLKLIAFGVLGFSFTLYLPLLAGLLAFGFAGTYAGKIMLHRLPERAFRIGLKTVLTLIALRLLWGAVGLKF